MTPSLHTPTPTVPMPFEAVPMADAATAAHRRFADMQRLFLRAVADETGRKGHWLRAHVRQARDPRDLWHLRGPVLAALRGDDPRTRELRGALYRSLDHAFENTDALARVLNQAAPGIPQA